MCWLVRGKAFTNIFAKGPHGNPSIYELLFENPGSVIEVIKGFKKEHQKRFVFVAQERGPVLKAPFIASVGTNEATDGKE